MYTKGKQPYEGMRGDEVVAFVEKGMYITEPIIEVGRKKQPIERSFAWICFSEYELNYMCNAS